MFILDYLRYKDMVKEFLEWVSMFQEVVRIWMYCFMIKYWYQ